MMVKIIYGTLAFLLGFNIIKVPTWLLIVVLALMLIFFWEAALFWVGIKFCFWLKRNFRGFNLEERLRVSPQK